jgi:hypothetical protein
MKHLQVDLTFENNSAKFKSGAVLSPCEKYRYELWREWDKSKPCVMFVMLNPSTADALKDDPTIRRCMNFAKNWGYGSIKVGNIFAFRSSNPKDLKVPSTELDYFHADQNAQYLNKMAYESKTVICAWGNPPIDFVSPLSGLSKLCHLGLTKKNNPRHPLYLKGETTPIEYTDYNY